VVCVEQSDRHANVIRQNFQSTGFATESFQVRVQDVFTAINQLAVGAQEFDLILADPPYGEKNVGRRSTSFAQRLLDDPDLPKILAPGGLFVVGHTKRDTLEVTGPWEDKKLLRHGDSVMRICVKRGT